MKWRLILLLAMMPGSLQGQTSKSEKPNIVERVCGRVTEVETSRRAWSYTVEMGPGHPRKADVLLYRREKKKKCCAQETLVAKMSTDGDGGFDFKDAALGQYWVVLVMGKKKYKLPVDLGSPAGDGPVCSDTIYQVKGDELRLLKMYKAYFMEENAQTH